MSNNNFVDDFEIIENQPASMPTNNNTSTSHEDAWDAVENIVFFEEMGFLHKGESKQLDLKVREVH